MKYLILLHILIFMAGSLKAQNISQIEHYPSANMIQGDYTYTSPLPVPEWLVETSDEFKITVLTDTSSSLIKDKLKEYAMQYSSDGKLSGPLLYQKLSYRILVFLCNFTTHDMILAGQDGTLPMIQEAMDKDGNWKPIEYWQNSWCGNSHMPFNLEKDKFVTVAGYRYDGDYKTKLRFVFRNGDKKYYSNEFEGTINYSQFNKPAGANRWMTFFDN